MMGSLWVIFHLTIIIVLNQSKKAYLFFHFSIQIFHLKVTVKVFTGRLEFYQPLLFHSDGKHLVHYLLVQIHQIHFYDLVRVMLWTKPGPITIYLTNLSMQFPNRFPL